jgi:hypothetical protein
MSYQNALSAAGAEIHEFKEFGSYQGEWFALVTYNGEKGWVQGCYGSCSGCDSFEAEFGWDDRETCNEHEYKGTDETRAACLGCQEAKARYTEKLAAFGRPYLEGLQPADTILKELDEQSRWDDESMEAAAWIRAKVAP